MRTSDMTKRTRNPIRAIVETLKPPVGREAEVIPLSLGACLLWGVGCAGTAFMRFSPLDFSACVYCRRVVRCAGVGPPMGPRWFKPLQ